MTLRILLLGANGQLGQALAKRVGTLGQVVPVTRAQCDFTRLLELRSWVRHARPDVIINAAAYTAVDRAEREAGVACLLNAELPAMLAEEASRLRACLVHYSTDYVFDGTIAGRYREEHPPAPLNVYGATKYQGETAVRAYERHLVLRTSWLFSTLPGNFLTTILRLAQERERLEVVVDQRGTPTSACLVAATTEGMLAGLLKGEGAYGLYHIASSGTASRHAYARYIVSEAWRIGYVLRCRPENVEPVTSTNTSALADRPRNSALDNRLAQSVFNLTFPCWHIQVSKVVAEKLRGALS